MLNLNGKTPTQIYSQLKVIFDCHNPSCGVCSLSNIVPLKFMILTFLHIILTFTTTTNGTALANKGTISKVTSRKYTNSNEEESTMMKK